MLAALGPKTMTWGGGIFDGVMLHTFFTDQTLRECVDRIRSGRRTSGPRPERGSRVGGARGADRSAGSRRVSKMLVGRMGTYLQAYGDVLVSTNGWDPQVLADFRAAPQVQEVQGTIDAVATSSQLEAIAELIPDEWLAASAVGSPELVASRIEDQFTAGADGVILHASTPDQLAGRGRGVPVTTTCRSVHRSLDQPGTLMAPEARRRSRRSSPPEWLTDVLRHGDAIGDDTRSSSFDASYIGTGQVGANVRYDADLRRRSRSGVDRLQVLVARRAERVDRGRHAHVRDRGRVLQRPRRHRRHQPAPLLLRRARARHRQRRARDGGSRAGRAGRPDRRLRRRAGDDRHRRGGEAARTALGRSRRSSELVWLDRSSQSGGMATMLPAIWDAFVDRYRVHARTRRDARRRGAASCRCFRNGRHTPPALHADPLRLPARQHAVRRRRRPLVVVDWQTVQLGWDRRTLRTSSATRSTRRAPRRASARWSSATTAPWSTTTASTATRSTSAGPSMSVRATRHLLMAVFASMMVGRDGPRRRDVHGDGQSLGADGRRPRRAHNHPRTLRFPSRATREPLELHRNVS